VADLSTNPVEYAPYPSDGGKDVCVTEQNQVSLDLLPQPLGPHIRSSSKVMPECSNCTVHTGFMSSWRNTRCIILPHIEKALALYPDYQVTLVGHSLGGAVAALASLEFKARGWEPQVTTFGEPRVGNQALVSFIDAQFNLTDQESPSDTYRRVTHVNDPVPLLPLEEWGYRMHAGEIFISKSRLPPSRADLQHCTGNRDSKCIAGGTSSDAQKVGNATRQRAQDWQLQEHGMWWVPPRYRLWQLFFAHRDYFWRLGLCVPGGDPSDWWREKYPHGDVPDEL